MKRRQFIQITGISAFGAIASAPLLEKQPLLAQSSDALDIQWLGHTCFVVKGGGKTILINPFLAISCTAGYRELFPEADVALLSSQLFDEGYTENLPGDPTLFLQAGQFPLDGITFNGLSLAHANIERYQGWRFPPNIAWSWRQAGLSILHLGGAGEVVDIDDFILTGGRPDIVMIPVGGNDSDPKNITPKGYTPNQALEVLNLLKPKIIIPTHYKTPAADETCGLQSIDAFLNLIDPDVMNVRNLSGDRLNVSTSALPQGKPIINVFRDEALLDL